MMDGKKFFDQPIKNDVKTYDNIQNIAIGRRNHYTTGCLLYCNYFNNYYNMIVIDSSKQQALDADPRAIQHITFTGNLSGNNSKHIVFNY